jgi:molybdopterin-guanine dinucleotide biosynthesis protein
MIVVTVSGTASEVGKTGLMCALLPRLPGWAAVKVTRGHYRSCGRDPETCCVSHLLGDRPRVFADRAVTGVEGKDTGRYWEAGAADVRWVVAARGQEHRGLAEALADLAGFDGVLVEGNRILERLPRPRLAILVAHPAQQEVKASARRILDRIDALFVPDVAVSGSLDDPSALVGAPRGTRRWPVLGPPDLDRLADALRL